MEFSFLGIMYSTVALLVTVQITLYISKIITKKNNDKDAGLRKKIYAEVENEYLKKVSEKTFKELDQARKLQIRRAEVLLESNLNSSFLLKNVSLKKAGILGDIQWHHPYLTLPSC
jgi:hypothetical protein